MISRRLIRFASTVLGFGMTVAAAGEPGVVESDVDAVEQMAVSRWESRRIEPVSAETPPDPLRGTPAIKPETTGEDAMQALAALLPGRSDAPYDWHAPVEPLHAPCEPRVLPPCVPPPPCHPSAPPRPYDLVGVAGCPTGGPIYRGPCEPRTGTPHHGPFAWYHRLHDRFVDHFYRWK